VYSLTAADRSNNSGTVTLQIQWLDTQPPAINVSLQPILIQSERASSSCGLQNATLAINVSEVLDVQQVSSVSFGQTDPSVSQAVDGADGVLDSRTFTSTYDAWVLGNQSVRYCYTDASDNTGCIAGQLVVVPLATVDQVYVTEMVYFPKQQLTLLLRALHAALSDSLASNPQGNVTTILYLVSVPVGSTASKMATPL
jgi:hypothetical protein